MSFTLLFVLFAAVMGLALWNRRREATALFLLGLVLSVALFVRHATDQLSISL